MNAGKSSGSALKETRGSQRAPGDQRQGGSRQKGTTRPHVNRQSSTHGLIPVAIQGRNGTGLQGKLDILMVIRRNRRETVYEPVGKLARGVIDEPSHHVNLHSNARAVVLVLVLAGFARRVMLIVSLYHFLETGIVPGIVQVRHGCQGSLGVAPTSQGENVTGGGSVAHQDVALQRDGVRHFPLCDVKDTLSTGRREWRHGLRQKVLGRLHK